MLKPCFKNNCLEAGLDEAGRGCLAGPVFAAAVILPKDFSHPLLHDSKLLNARQRDILRAEIENNAISWAVKSVDETTIDSINILKAAIKAMHLSVEALNPNPEHLLIDGNYFIPYQNIAYKTIVKGDNTYQNIAAASILAKTHRDMYMQQLHELFPEYHWDKNKGYGTAKHIEALKKYGTTPHHRKSFQPKSLQIQLFEVELNS